MQKSQRSRLRRGTGLPRSWKLGRQGRKPVACAPGTQKAAEYFPKQISAPWTDRERARRRRHQIHLSGLRLHPRPACMAVTHPVPAAALLGPHAASFLNTPLLTRIDAPRCPQNQISASQLRCSCSLGYLEVSLPCPTPPPPPCALEHGVGALGWKLHKANASTRGPQAPLGLPSKLRPKPPSSPSGSAPSPDTPLLAGRWPCAHSRGMGPWFSFSLVSSPCTGPQAAAAHSHSPPECPPITITAPSFSKPQHPPRPPSAASPASRAPAAWGRQRAVPVQLLG